MIEDTCQQVPFITLLISPAYEKEGSDKRSKVDSVFHSMFVAYIKG